MKYQVEVMHSISTTVEIEADSPDAAVQAVSRADFPLPPRDEWSGMKDWEITVYGPNGEELDADDEKADVDA